MRKNKGSKSTYYKYAAIALLVVFLISAAFFAMGIWERSQGTFPGINPDDDTITYQGKKYRENKDLETFLVLGLDKFDSEADEDSYNNNKQADFVLLFIFDNETKKCTTLHINRDTMVEMNVLGVAGNKVATVTKQLALAHTYGNGRDVSCRNTADAISKLLLGVQIDHYMSVTMDAVPEFNDLVGGVEVTVLDDFTGIDETLVKGETVTLTGKQALTYVRTRYGLEDSSNSTRMVRQQQYLQALRQKVARKMDTDEEFVMNAAVALSEHMISDRSVNQLQQIADRYYAYEDGGVLELQGELKLGEQFMEFYPDGEELLELVVQLFCEPV